MVRKLFVFLSFFRCILAEYSLDEEVRAMKVQLNVLLDTRQKDFELYQQYFTKSKEKESEIHDLRNEVDFLRKELESVRYERLSSNGRQHKQETVQWLADSVSEIRGELSELAKSYNSSTEREHYQNVRTDISIMQNDVVSVRHDIDVLKNAVSILTNKMTTVSQDIDFAIQISRSTAEILTNYTDKLNAIKMELLKSQNVNKENEGAVFKRMVVSEEDPIKMREEQVLENEIISWRSKCRHCSKLVNKRIDAFRSTLKSLVSSQRKIKHQIYKLESDTARTESRNIDGNVVKNLTDLDNRFQKYALNTSLRLDEQEKLHASVLELLESVESLENKMDSVTPNFKREISKMEFNLAQLVSTTALMKEDQDNQRVSVKAMSESLSAMQEKQRVQSEQIYLLERDMNKTSDDSENNYDLQSTSETNDENRKMIGDTIYELNRIHTDYNRIISQLPNDCSEIEGSGLHVISAGGRTPLLVDCKVVLEGKDIVRYTVIQRRINGLQDFNKNWEEYAKGFGSPSGEFWIGNEALHHLTSNNDTSLRIDFKDIFGANWYAEYKDFRVGDRQDGYRLHVSGYSGNSSDALDYQNRMQFSTVDSDRDISNTNCASNYEGGWWFSHCQHSNLNGRYNLGLTWFDGTKNEWIAVSYTEIKIKKIK